MTGTTEPPSTDAIARKSSAPRVWRAWRSSVPKLPFWIFFVASLLFALGFSAYFFLYGVFLVHLGFAEAQIGRVTASLTLGTMGGTVFLGIVASRYGIRRILLFCIPFAALISAVRVSLPSYGSQVMFGVLTGLTLCAWGVCLAPSVASLCDQNTRPFAFSAIFASGIAITGVGSLIASRAPTLLQRIYAAQHLSVPEAQHTVAVFACGLAALAAIPIAVLPLGSLPRREGKFYVHPYVWRFLPAVALWTFGSGALVPFVTAFFTRHLSVSVERLGSILSLSQVAQTAGILLAPLLLRRLGSGRGMLVSQLAAALGLILLGSAHGVGSAAAFYWLFIGLNCMSEPSLFSLLMDNVPPEHRSSASAMHQLVSSVTLTVAAIAAGSAISVLGYRPVVFALALCAAGAALLLQRLGRESNARYGG